MLDTVVSHEKEREVSHITDKVKYIYRQFLLCVAIFNQSKRGLKLISLNAM